jgi:histone H1/5
VKKAPAAKKVVAKKPAAKKAPAVKKAVAKKPAGAAPAKRGRKPKAAAPVVAA